MLQQAVFQLLDHYQDVEALIRENACDVLPTTGTIISDVSQSGEPGEQASLSVDSILSVLTEQSEMSGTPLQSLAASQCASRMKKMLQVSPGTLLLTESQQNLAGVFVAVIQKIQRQHSFSRNLFIKLLNKENKLPVELIWLLHKENIMPLDAYITCNLSRPDAIGNLSQSLARLCHLDAAETLERRTRIVPDLVGYLIRLSYTDKTKEDSTARGLRKVCSALLDSVTKKIFSNKSLQGLDVMLYEISFSTSDVDPGILKKFCSRQLSVILSLDPSFKVAQAFSEQHTWTYAKMPEYVTSVYKQLLVVFDAPEVIDLLQNILEQHEVNWKAVLSLVATIIVCFTEAPALLKESIAGMLKKGLENAELDSLITSFLLARQGALEGPHVFQSYQDWFSDTFGDGSKSCANTKRSFVFLLKFLSDVVPYEGSQYLRAHMLKPPYVPPKCRPVLSDYISLAKTRLLDLKETVDELGIYGEQPGSTAATASDIQQKKQQAEEDVEKVLESFDRTGKVPSSIMEASIFRKPYFVGRFLPALLKPRPLPDIPDTRMKFIQVLVKADKIPPQMLKNYEEGCKKCAAELLEGVFNIDDDAEDDDMADMLLSPWQQLHSSLQSLQDAVCQTAQPKSHFAKGPSITAQISLICEKISNLFSQDSSLKSEMEQSPHGDAPLELDVNDTQQGKLPVEIAECILDKVCEIVNNGESGVTTGPLTWLSQLLVMITQFPKVHKAILLKIWRLLTREGPKLEPLKIHSLATVVLQFSTSPAIVDNVFISAGGKRHLYLNKLLGALHVKDNNWMQYSLRFCNSYLQVALNSYPAIALVPTADSAVVHPTVLKLFMYLVPRLYPEARHAGGHLAQGHMSRSRSQFDPTLLKETLQVHNSRELKELQSQTKFTLEEWTSLEFSSQCCKSPEELVARQQYQDWCLQEVFLPRPQDQGGCGGSVHTLCSSLLSFLLRQTGAAARDGLAEVVLLLQRCAHLLPSICHSDQEPQTVWLMSAYRQCCCLETADNVSMELQTQLFFSITQCLPAYLLLSNQPVGKGMTIPASAWEDLVEAVNGVLKNYLTTGICLSHDITSHLLQCLLHLPDSDDNRAAVDNCLSRCPVIFRSFLYHWPTLEYQSRGRPVGESAIQPVLERIQRMVNAVSRMLEGGESSTAGLELCQPYLFCGSAVFCHIKRVSSQPDLKHTIQVLNRMSQSSGHFLEVVSGFQDCFLGSLAWDYLFMTQPPDTDPSTVLQSLWSRQPSLFAALVVSETGTDAARLQHSFPDVVQKLLPAVVFKVLSSADQLTQTTVFSQAGNIETLLKLHTKVVALYETLSPSGDVGTLSICPLISMQFMSEMNRFLKQTLHRTPVQFLQNIPESVVSHCDDDIQSLLQHLAHRQ